MKRRNNILLAIIIGIGGIGFILASKYTYESRVSELRNKGREAFEDALNKELQNRNIEQPVIFSMNADAALKEIIPDSVCIEDVAGEHWYKLDPRKHQMNVTMDRKLRVIHSFIFLKYPLHPDSLNATWKKCLVRYDVLIPSAVDILTSNEKNQIISCLTSANSEWKNSSNKIFTFYMGHACEKELTGYLHYSFWHIMYLYCLFYGLIYGIYVYGGYKVCIEKRKTILEIVQKKLIKKSVLPVGKKVNDTPIHFYILRKNIIFYAEQKKIEIDGMEKRMTVQSAQLLELFLKEEENGYILFDNIASQKLWPDGAGTQVRYQKAVNRLCHFLQNIASDIEIKRGIGSYQLIL